MARSKTPPSPAKPDRKRAARGGKFVAARDADPEAHGLAIITEPELHRREAFAQAFVATGVASEAARKAGYTGTPKVIAQIAHRLMGEPLVRQRIRKIQDDVIARIKVDQTAVLAELTRIAFLDPGEIFDEKGELRMMHQIPEDVRRAISGYKVTTKTFGKDGESVEKEVKFVSKEGALEKLGKHLGLWKADTDDGKFTAEAFLKAMLEARERVNRSIQVRQLPA